MKPSRKKLIWRLVLVVGIIYGATLAILYFQTLQEPVHIKWTFPAGGRFGQPLIQPDGSLIVGAMDGKVYKLTSEGEEIWSCDTGSQIRYGVTQANNNTIYAINDAKDLCAIDSGGKLLWKTPTGQTVGMEGKITVGKDAIYVSKLERIYSVSTNGTINWTYNDNASFWKKILITEDGKLIIGEKQNSTQDVYLLCLNPDGSIHWKTKVANNIFSAAIFLPNGNLVVGSDDGLLCFDVNGVLQWNALQGNRFRSTPVVDTIGITYCASLMGEVFAVDINGREVWKAKLSAPSVREFRCMSEITLGLDSSLYIGVSDTSEPSFLDILRQIPHHNYQQLNEPGYLFCLSTQSGKQKWRFKAPESLEATAAISSDGTVYIQSWDNTLYALEPR